MTALFQIFEVYRSDFWGTQRKVNYSNQYMRQNECAGDSFESIRSEILMDRTHLMEFTTDMYGICVAGKREFDQE